MKCLLKVYLSKGSIGSRFILNIQCFIKFMFRFANIELRKFQTSLTEFKIIALNISACAIFVKP